MAYQDDGMALCGSPHAEKAGTQMARFSDGRVALTSFVCMFDEWN